MLQEIAEQAGLLLLQVLGIPQHAIWIVLGEQGLLQPRQPCHRQARSARLLGTMTTMVWEVAEASAPPPDWGYS